LEYSAVVVLSADSSDGVVPAIVKVEISASKVAVVCNRPEQREFFTIAMPTPQDIFTQKPARQCSNKKQPPWELSFFVIFDALLST
jgi:hypothetical protein